MQLKRVVVTGLGALTPLGNNLNDYWSGLINGVSGANLITHFDASKFKTKFACELKNFNVEDHIERKEARRMDPYTHYALVVAKEAIIDSGMNLDAVNKDRVGVIWGSGIGGLLTFQEECIAYAKGDGSPRFNPFFIPKMIADIASGHISIIYGFRGPNYTTTSACASSNNAMIDAFNLIRLGKSILSLPAVPKLLLQKRESVVLMPAKRCLKIMRIIPLLLVLLIKPAMDLFLAKVLVVLFWKSTSTPKRVEPKFIVK
jgi:3-oxoacyl-[acyl-carrier-protein] synthase II